MKKNEKKYYRAKEVAKFLGIALSTVLMYVKQGKLKPLKLSTRVTVFSIKKRGHKKRKKRGQATLLIKCFLLGLPLGLKIVTFFILY